LAISRKFCQLMGGDITVESEEGVGSIFTMRIPVEAQHEPYSTDNDFFDNNGFKKTETVNLNSQVIGNW